MSVYEHLKELRISFSSLSSYYSCARKLEFAKFYQHARKDENLAGEVGNAMHEGFQEYLMTGDKDRAVAAMMLRYPIHLCSNPNEGRSIEACYATLQAMMQSPALVEYSLVNIEALDGETYPAVEVPFEITIKDFYLNKANTIPVIYTGFIDALLFNELTGEYLVVDIKTHRQNVNDMTAAYRFSDQCLPYGIILERMLGHELDEMNVKYLSVYIDIANPEVKLYSFDKSKNEIRDWAKGFLIALQNIKMFYEMEWFPRRGDNCMSFNRPCQYFDICESRNPESIKNHFLFGSSPWQGRNVEPWIKLELELGK